MKNDYISKDIQKELYALCKGMTSNNIYSQLAYFLDKRK